MSIYFRILAQSLLAVTLAAGTVVAQGPPPGSGRPGGPPSSTWRPPRPPGAPGGFVRHSSWRRGRRVPMSTWRRGMVVNDWGRYRLMRPPMGYEWRFIDGNFVLAAVATGLIASVIIAAAQ
jgi:hypothetical protein